MAKFDSIVGHEIAKKLLTSAIENNRLSHAYLFIGPASLGKFKFAIELAKIIQCRDDSENRGIKIENGTDPDVLIIDPDKKDKDSKDKNSAEKTKVITIEEIRLLEHHLSLFPYDSKYKIAIVNGAQKFSDEAVNAFLKTLEEPRGNSIIVLIAEGRHFLPETLVSRAQIIRFWPVKKGEIENYLANCGFGRRNAEKIASVSQGKPGLALKMAKSREKLSAYTAEAENFNSFVKDELRNRFLSAEKMAKNDDKLPDILRLWLELAREKLLEIYASRDTGGGTSMNRERILKFIHGLNLTINLITTSNVNKKLALENLALEI